MGAAAARAIPFPPRPARAHAPINAPILRGIRVDQDALGVQEQVLPLQEEAPPGPVGPEAPSVLREAEEGVRVGQ